MHMSASLCFSGAVVPLGVVSRGVSMEMRDVCLQEECRSLKEQVAMDNDACMVVLLQSVFWVILVLRHCRYDFLGMERGMSETAFSNLLDCREYLIPMI